MPDEATEGRFCGTCSQWRPWSEFAASRRYSSGYQPNCRKCSHQRSIRTQYGMTPADFDWLMESQAGLCALCGHDPTGERRLCVDHDHSCCGPLKACPKCIRGLLCHPCNRILGLAETRPGLHHLFAEYLASRPLRQ